MSAGNLIDIAKKVVALAQKHGAQGAAANAARARDVDIQWRDGKLEKITEATTRGVSVQLYVDGRYSTVSTSDLRPDALDKFIREAVVLTKALSQDPARQLPDPALYAGQAKIDLELEDKAYDAVTAQQRREQAAAIEAAARQVKGAEHIVSVTSQVGDRLMEMGRVHSNGFEGTQRTTSFYGGAGVSVKDPDGRRPEESFFAGSRHRNVLPGVEEMGKKASERTLGRLGSQKMKSEVLPMVVENRVGGGIVGRLAGPLMGGALQQKRSCLDGKLGQQVGSALLDVSDDPHVVRGLGSRLFDGEGIASKKMPIFEGGVLRAYFIDTYYGRKLKMQPTTASPSNLSWKLGEKDLAGLLADVKEGVYVTGFLGGNSNGTTGDFSLGVQGFRIRGGQLAEPVAEMNIAGNHLEHWKKLVAVGNDPYPYSALRTPTLVFEGVQFAGT